MFRFSVYYFVLLIGIITLSCNKSTVDSGPAIIPATWGKLSVIKQSIVKISGTDTMTTIAQVAQANFYANPSNSSALLDVGSVKINGTNVTKDNNHIYLKESNSFDLDNKIEWTVDGNSMVQKFTYNDTLVFPEYKGNFPITINKSTGLLLTFDSATVMNADSVRVMIDDTYNHIVQQTFSAKAGQVTILPTTLSSLNTINDQTAVIAIMPYAGRVKVFHNKGFFFAREQRLFRSVNIN